MYNRLGSRPAPSTGRLAIALRGIGVPYLEVLKYEYSWSRAWEWRAQLTSERNKRTSLQRSLKIDGLQRNLRANRVCIDSLF